MFYSNQYFKSDNSTHKLSEVTQNEHYNKMIANINKNKSQIKTQQIKNKTKQLDKIEEFLNNNTIYSKYDNNYIWNRYQVSFGYSENMGVSIADNGLPYTKSECINQTKNILIHNNIKNCKQLLEKFKQKDLPTKQIIIKSFNFNDDINGKTIYYIKCNQNRYSSIIQNLRNFRDFNSDNIDIKIKNNTLTWFFEYNNKENSTYISKYNNNLNIINQKNITCKLKNIKKLNNYNKENHFKIKDIGKITFKYNKNINTENFKAKITLNYYKNKINSTLITQNFFINS